MNNLKKFSVFVGLMFLLVCTSCTRNIRQTTPTKIQIKDHSVNNHQIYIGDNKITIMVKHDEKYGGFHFVFFQGDSLVILTTENTIVIKGLYCLKCAN